MNTDQKPLQVAISTGTPIKDFHRLSPHGSLQWGRCEFVLNPDDDTPFDYWIVYVTAPRRTQLICAPENTLFISGEPPSKKIYPTGFYQQFYRLVCTSAEYPHPRVTFDALGINWHVGHNRLTGEYRYGYDELVDMQPAEKQLAISVVCSDLRTKQGQRMRLEFLDRLKQYFGKKIVHYGRGFSPIDDKMDGIAPYHYHLVLENSSSDDYWTEKLADAYLGWSFPLYVGCPNLAKYFPENSYIPLTLENFDLAVQVIEKALSAPPSNDQLAGMAQARDLILNRYNPFARFSHWAELFHDPNATPVTHRITPYKAFARFPTGALYRLRKGYF